jgi:hypothetical protein
MCWCDPQKRTPICDTCPPEKKAEWPQYQKPPQTLEEFMKVNGLGDEDMVNDVSRSDYTGE